MNNDFINYKDYSGYFNDNRFKTSAGQRCGSFLTVTVNPEHHSLGFVPHINISEVSNYMPGTSANAISSDDRKYLMKYLVAYNGIDPKTYYTGESLIYEYDEFTSGPAYQLTSLKLDSLNPPNLIGIDKDLGRTVVKITNLTGEANINEAIHYTVRYNAPLLVRDLVLNVDNSCIYLDGWYTHYAIAVREYVSTKDYVLGDIVSYEKKAWSETQSYNPEEVVTYNGYYYKAESYIAASTDSPEVDEASWTKGNKCSNFFVRTEITDSSKAALSPFFEDSFWSSEISFENWYNWMRTLEYAFNESNAKKDITGRYVQTHFVITYELEMAIRKETQSICDSCIKDEIFYEYSHLKDWLKLRQKRGAIQYFFEACNFKPMQEVIESTRSACKACNTTLCLT